MCSTMGTYSFQLFRCILSKNIDGYYQRQTEFFNIFNVFFQIDDTFFHSVHIRRSQVRLRHPAMHLQCAHCSNQHNSIRLQPGITAFDVKEFFSAQISAEACFCNRIISQLHSRLSCHHAVAAVGDIGKRPAVNNRRHIFQCLHKIRLHSILQKGSHSAVGFDLPCGNRFAVIIISNNDLA